MSETGNTAQKKLNPSKTATPDAGAKYEISVATLVAAILSNNDKIENYHVFTNLKEAYPFDDIVAKVFFKGENTPYAFAMQLKHIGKGETLDVEKYLKGYNKISNAGGLKTIGNIGIANIHFCYFCIDKVKKADSYTPHQYKPISDSWRSALSFPNCHKLTFDTEFTETNTDFLNNFYLYLYQPNNNKIKENIKTLCKIQDVSGALNFIDRYFEKVVLWKRGLRKEVFETELLRIRLSDHILLPPADIIQIHEPQSAMWHNLTLQHNVTIVKVETNIEKSLYGSCAQALNRLFNNNFNWSTYKTNPLDSRIVEEFKKLFRANKSHRISHWIDPPTTLKALIIELWKIDEIPLILRSDDNLPVLKDYAHLSKSYIIVTENVATKRKECNNYQLSVFTHVSDIKCLDMRDELLQAISISLQGREPITLHSIIDRHWELITALSCSHIIHLMKSRMAYLSRECLDGDHNLLFLIEDPNSTADYNINSINRTGGNIAIRCRPEDMAKYRKQIEDSPNLQNYEIYHCVASSRTENFIVLEGNKSLLGDFFVDQDGEDVYVLENEPVPIVGSTLKRIQPRYMPRCSHNALVSKSLFDSKTKGICFFSGNFSYLTENIRQDLMEASDDINFDNVKNTFIQVKVEDVHIYWQKASDLKCPLIHIRVESTGMYLRRYKDWANLSEHISYNGQEIPEENILKEVTDGITILTGEPGIGKSSLLQSIFKNHATEKYVLFYNLVDYGYFLEKEKLVPTNISLDFLLERSMNKRYKELLSAFFRKKDRVLILLDSFDEVLPTYKEHVLHFIRNLAASNVQMIIASRTIANYVLMANFEATILKVDFLGADDCEEYIKNFGLNENILSTVPDEFLQNPLYLNFLKTISESNVSLEHFSKLSLFKSVIEIKMEQYFQRYFSIQLISNKEYYLKPVREIHFQLALIRILGADIVKELLQLENKSELTHEFKLGVVLSINEEGYPTFVHETFAEYLTADWIIRNGTEDSAKKIYQEIKKQKKLYILDILCEHLELHKAVLTQNKQQIEEYAADRPHLERADALGRMAIHIAAAHQPEPVWSALDIIICNMRNFEIDFTRSDILMQWDWIQQSYQKNIIESMMLAGISTSLWEAYVSCIAQKAQNDSNYINLFNEYDITKMYDVAVRSNSIEMIRDLIFIENLKNNGVSQALEVHTLHLRSVRKFAALHVPCINGNVEALRKLIKREHINTTDMFGCTPLHYSVMNPPEVSTIMTKMLLEYGSKLDIKNYYRKTALDIAVLSGNVHITELLLQNYVHIKRESVLDLVFLAIEEASNRSAARSIKKANKRHLEIINLLLEKGADVSGRNANGKTPLIFASECGESDVIKVLLENGADVNRATRNGKAPLMFASQYGKLDIVKLLLEKDASVNATTTDGNTPLMFASRYGGLDIAKVLLEKGANVNGVEREGKTPLMIASIYGKLDIVIILLENDAEVNDADTDGKTPFIFACQYGRLDTAKVLLEKGADVNGATRTGKTPLMFASQYGKLDIIKMLLENGADVNGAKRNGKTPLMFASICGKLDIVELLLEKGANVNGATTNGKTPLLFASEWGTLDIVKILLENGADVNGAERDGKTPFIFACQYGRLDIAQILLEKGADVNGATRNGKTPLMFASQFGKLDMVKVLLEKGVDVNGATTDGKTPLMFASQYGRLDITKILLEKGANVNRAEGDGKTPLMFASEYGKLDTVRILLEKGADVNGATTTGETPLMFVSQYGRLDIAKILLENGANVNRAEGDGKTPLMFATEYGNLDIVRILLENGADVNGAERGGKTPLIFASEYGKLDIVRILLENGADVNGAERHGETPLMIASIYDKLDIAKVLLEKSADVNGATVDGTTSLMFASTSGSLNIVKMLLEKGASVNSATADGKTPLMFASRDGFLNIVRMLLEKGAGVNSATADGETPLMIASEEGNLDIVEILLEKGADVNSATASGEIPLMFACQYGKLDIVKMLLEKDADVNGASAVGTTSLMIASRYGKLDIVKMLLEKDADVNGATIVGTTPLMFACQYGKLNIVEILLERGADVNSVTTFGNTALIFAYNAGYMEVVDVLLRFGASTTSFESSRFSGLTACLPLWLRQLLGI